MHSILARGTSRVAIAVFLALIASVHVLASEADQDLAGKVDPRHEGNGDWRTPAPPAGAGYTDNAPVANEQTVLPFVDYVSTNQRGIACDATLEGNAGVRVVSGFLDIWQPSTLLVDAGVSAPAQGTCPAVTASTWSGIPRDSTDGVVLNYKVHNANIQYVITATARRSSAQELAAYLDDRRGKGYSISDGMGPLTDIWRELSEQFTTIVDIPADATTVLYNDLGNNVGVGNSANTHNFGIVVDLLANIGENGSTEPAKRFYKYARPWRWSSSVKVVPALVPAESSNPPTDGGYISGHEAEAMRDGIAAAYVVPERFQEMLTRAGELGEDRILAGMHSPLDVIGGRLLGEAVATASLATGLNSGHKAAAFAQAQNTLMATAGVADAAGLHALAHSQGVRADRFADHARNKASYLHYMTYGFAQIGDRTKPATVPKDAEVLLETRLPYLDAEQRRVVLKTTAVASGYPVLDDAEGWGRLNLFAAADGYGALNGDVTVSMDASQGGFSAVDAWQNNIAGVGKLTKQGSGTLKLTGANRYSGGTEVQAGVLEADAGVAFGTGDVYVSGGTLASNAAEPLNVFGRFTQLSAGTLELNLGSHGEGRLNVRGHVTLAGGALHVKVKPGCRPVVGGVIDAIESSQGIQGRFQSITVDGFHVTPIYTRTRLLLRIVR
ncbi:MAG: autotransporter-associated beta strand repeat-containing protein [Steroidobacteraceae bacterium]